MKRYTVHYTDSNGAVARARINAKSLLEAKQQATQWAPALQTITLYDEEGNGLADRRFYDSGEGWWDYLPWEDA